MEAEQAHAAYLASRKAVREAEWDATSVLQLQDAKQFKAVAIGEDIGKSPAWCRGTLAALFALGCGDPLDHREQMEP